MGSVLVLLTIYGFAALCERRDNRRNARIVGELLRQLERQDFSGKLARALGEELVGELARMHLDMLNTKGEGEESLSL
jgi:hypothetical protein